MTLRDLQINGFFNTQYIIELYSPIEDTWYTKLSYYDVLENFLELVFDERVVGYYIDLDQEFELEDNDTVLVFDEEYENDPVKIKIRFIAKQYVKII